MLVYQRVKGKSSTHGSFPQLCGSEKIWEHLGKHGINGACKGIIRTMSVYWSIVAMCFTAMRQSSKNWAGEDDLLGLPTFFCQQKLHPMGMENTYIVKTCRNKCHKMSNPPTFLNIFKQIPLRSRFDQMLNWPVIGGAPKDVWGTRT